MRTLREHAPLFVLILGTLFSVFVFFYIRREEARGRQSEFFRRAQNIALRAEDYLRHREETLYTLRDLFEYAPEVTRVQFNGVATDLISRQVGIQALEWVPLVPSAERARYEAEAQAADLPQYQFTERPSTPGGLVRTGDRPVHAPVYFLVPMVGNELALGFDLASDPTIWARMLQIADAGKLAASGRVPLLASARGGPNWGYITELPVYRRPLPVLAPAERRAELKGYILGVFQLSEVLEEMFQRMGGLGVDVLFIDRSAPAERQFLHYHPDQPSGANPPTVKQISAGLHDTLPLEHAGRHWELWLRPSAPWLAAQPVYRAWVFSTLFFSLSALLSLFLRGQQRRASLVRQIVAERTAELTESRRKLDSFLRAMPGMAYRGTYDDKLNLDFVSEGAFALTGWEAGEFLAGRIHLRDFIHPDDLPRVRAITREGLETRREIEVEYRIRTREGGEKWLLSRGRGVYHQGELPVFEGLAIDITAQKNAEGERLALERKLLEGQKLESLGLLAGGIAHDFNNLLTSILGNAGIARLALPPGAPVETQLVAIEDGATRAAELCRQMLAYAGKGRFIVEAVDVSALAEGLVPLLEISIARKARLRLDLDRSLPAVMADATQLRQIVMNLVLNAVDAGVEGKGEIALSTGTLRANRAVLDAAVAGSALTEGEFVFLEVRDNGSGMPPEVLSRIFDPFFTTKFAGRGLGLAAVLGIVRGHHAALAVESAPGHGSVFRLLLPVAHGVMVPRPPPAPPTTAWQYTGHALLVDDDEAVRIVAGAMMHSFGFTVRAVPDGRSGLDVFREKPGNFDIVLLDLLMPGLTGEQTLEILRTIQPDIRVLIISGFSESDVMQRLANDRGPFKFLHKPFKRSELEQKLRELLG